MNTGQPTALPPDEDLIRRLKASDERALEVVIVAYWQRLVRFVDGILGQEGAGEDVVQEAFIRLWMRRAELRIEGSFRALLFTLARNAAIDELRRGGRRTALTSKLDPPSPQPSPLRALEESELREAADTAIASLPPRRREVFRLARTEGLTYKEIAGVLGLSPQTVANQMSRALTALHEALDPIFKERMSGEHDGTVADG